MLGGRARFDSWTFDSLVVCGGPETHSHTDRCTDFVFHTVDVYTVAMSAPL